MNAALAAARDEPSATSRFGRWIIRATTRLGWRQVALAGLISILAFTFGPNGGAFLFPGDRISDPFADWLRGRWLCGILPIVFAAMVGDEAYEDGVNAVVAYGLALVVGAFAAGFIDAWVGLLTGWTRSGAWQPNSFRLKQALLQGALAIAVYGYWRTTQRARRRVRASEADRVVGRQQLLAARLMALQARVEPEFLFNALSRIGALHERDARGADAMLADLIALLRAMLPIGTASTSTVAREFLLAGAWLRVQQHMDATLAVEIAASPLAAPCGLGAMIVIPLLQEMEALPGSSRFAWRLSAELLPSTAVSAGEAAGARVPRLCLRLAPVVPLPEFAGEVPDTPGVSRIRERLAELHGSAATLSVAMLVDQAPAFVLDLPIVQETLTDDHRPDR